MKKNETHESLRNFVKSKFGSMRAFADVSGIKFSQINGFLYRDDENISEQEQKKITASYELAKSLDPAEPIITEDEKEAIKLLYEKFYGSCKVMSEKMELNHGDVSKVVFGVYLRKNEFVKKVIDHLIDVSKTWKDVSRLQKQAEKVLTKSK